MKHYTGNSESLVKPFPSASVILQNKNISDTQGNQKKIRLANKLDFSF